MDDLIQDLAPVEAVARKAGSLIRRHYRGGVALELKTRRQAITAADTEAEHLIKEHLLALCAADFYGEEGGGEVIHRGYQWVVDPLDGTENMSGYPPLV